MENENELETFKRLLREEKRGREEERRRREVAESQYEEERRRRGQLATASQPTTLQQYLEACHSLDLATSIGLRRGRESRRSPSNTSRPTSSV